MALKLLPPKAWRFANCCSTLVISSPVSKIRAKIFGSFSICFHRTLSPLPKTRLRTTRQQEKRHEPAISKPDQSRSGQSPGQTVFASLLDRPSPSLPASGTHRLQEHGPQALSRLGSPPPYAYGPPASPDRARYHRSSRSLHADRRRESFCTFCAGDRTNPTSLHRVLR